MSLAEDLEEFEEQIRLQNTASKVEQKKTRTDSDGTVMEWDEKRKAWFPKIDDDFIAQYQMNYGVFTQDTDTATKDTSKNNGDGSSDPVSIDWTDFNAKLTKLKEEKGEESEEVKQLTKAANDALLAYYDSPAYREWYANYCRIHSEQNISTINPSEPHKTSSKSKRDMKPAERMLSSLQDDGEDPDVALARAEAELQLGIPLDNTTKASDPNNSEESHPILDSTDQGNQNVCPPPATQKRKQTVPPPAWYEMDDEKNTHVYVSGLPPDIDDEAFVALMSKYGVIMNEPFTNTPRAKLYRDETGKPKGDGRCCYIKVESVELALKILDGMTYAPGYVLHVERAKFQPKGHFDPKKRRRLTLKEKKKLREQQENLFRWGIDTSRFVRGKKERVIVLKNAFLETDFQRDVTLIPLVRERLRVQSAKCGVVKKIVVHDANPNGAVSITFCTPEEADMALGFFQNALFDYPGTGGARQLTAERWDGKTNYSVRESAQEESSRIQNWEQYLGGESSDDEDKAANQSQDTEDCEKQVQENLPDEQVVTSLDYWENLSEEDSPFRDVDTDEELPKSDDDGDGRGAETP